MLIAPTKKGEKAREACKYMLSSHYKPFALVCFHCYACQLCAFIVFMKMTERHFPFPLNRKTLLEIRQVDDVTGNLFSLFCPTWCEVFKTFARFFGLSEWRHSLLYSRSLCSLSRSASAYKWLLRTQPHSNSLCVCGLTNKPIMYKKLDNMWATGR